MSRLWSEGWKPLLFVPPSKCPACCGDDTFWGHRPGCFRAPSDEMRAVVTGQEYADVRQTDDHAAPARDERKDAAPMSTPFPFTVDQPVIVRAPGTLDRKRGKVHAIVWSAALQRDIAWVKVDGDPELHTFGAERLEAAL